MLMKKRELLKVEGRRKMTGGTGGPLVYRTLGAKFTALKLSSSASVGKQRHHRAIPEAIQNTPNRVPNTGKVDTTRCVAHSDNPA
jgi:hypothetical protein